jgi:cytochrome c
MKPLNSLLAGLFLAGFSPCSTIAAQAAAAGVSTTAADAARAQALLDYAISHYKAKGEAALAAFHRVNDFRDGELYVYVLSADGVMLTSGGSSSALIGRNVRDLRDSEGKQFMREILDTAAAKGSGVVEYRWLNQQHAKIERKVAYFRNVGDRILVVGYYAPHASAEQAKAMLWRASHELKQYGAKAIDRFNDLNGGFVQDDLYVFVVGLEDRRMHAHGGQPRLVGRNVAELADPQGKPIIRQMIEIARTRGEGEIDYLWKNPVTGGEESKRTYFRRVDGYLVAVGAYQP